MKLTAKAVAALAMPAGKTDHIVWDEDMPGFGFRLRRSPDGKTTLRRWVVQYRHGGRSPRIQWDPAVVTAESARQEAKKILAKAALGQDPAAERRDRRDRDRATLRVMIDEYIAAKQDKLRRKTLREMTRYLGKPYLGALFNMPADTITRRDIASRAVALTRERSPIVARKAYDTWSAFYVWAMKMGLVESNPVIGAMRPEGGKPRERVLTDDELRRVWLACQDDDYGRIIRLCICLGCRRAEAGGIAFKELDLEGPQPSWRIPPERSKNGKAHTLPLLAMSLDIIRSVPRMATRDQLFGVYSGAGFTTWDRHKQALDERSGVIAWNPHDLRRTLSTRLHDLGVAPHVVEQILNHQGHRGQIGGTYNKSFYEREVRAALALWEDYIRTLVEGGERKVLVLPQQSA